MIPAREAIDKQLMLKAASGYPSTMREYFKMRDRCTLDHLNVQLKSLQLLLEGRD